jgi:PPK2 family polyphosphate:nucleotide phosphotransferase
VLPKIDHPEIVDQWRVPAGKKIKLTDYDSGWAGDPSRPEAERRKVAEEILSQNVSSLAKDQDLLYASDSWSILIVLQAMDAAGKDGLIKHVMSGVNPTGCQVYSFKQPSREELDHTFLWRFMKALPERGRIGIFNRSYYEDVLVVRVHSNLVRAGRIPGADPDDKGFWKERFDDINTFERHLVRNGTVVLKFFLNVSKKKQHKRLLKRLDDPNKHWKFSAQDLAERDYWNDYMKAYEDVFNATSTDWAPWFILPADNKWVTRALAATIVARTIESLGLKYPEVTPEQRQAIEAARKELRGDSA